MRYLLILCVLLCGCLPDSPVVVKNEEIIFDEPVILDEDSATVKKTDISKITFSYGPYYKGGTYIDRGKIVVFLTGVGLLDMAGYVANHGGNFSDTVVAEIYDNGIRFNNAFITAFGSSTYQTKVTMMVDTIPYNAFVDDFDAWAKQKGLFKLTYQGESTLTGNRTYQQLMYEREE